MEPERIVVINDASTARGGATGLALLSVRLLLGQGLPVTLVCGDDGENPELATLDVEVVALGQGRLLARRPLEAARAGLWNRDARDSLAAWIAAHDTPRTIYHLHGWAQIHSPAIFAALRAVARRTILHAHDFFLACPNGVYMDFQRQQACARTPFSASCLGTQCDKRSRAQKGWRTLRHAVLRRELARGDWAAVAMIHPGMAEPLARGGVPRHLLRTLRNPAAPATERRIPAEQNARFAFVGRLAPEKGPLDLARAAAALGVPVTFVGEGPLEETVREILPQAEITGWQDRAGVARHLARARALVMPSRLPEPFGLAAAEASLAGLPIVLPRIALMAPEIEAAGLGRAYDAREAGGLAAALTEVRDMPLPDVAEISRRGHARVAALAETPEAWVDRLRGLYADALARA